MKAVLATGGTREEAARAAAEAANRQNEAPPAYSDYYHIWTHKPQFSSSSRQNEAPPQAATSPGKKSGVRFANAEKEEQDQEEEEEEEEEAVKQQQQQQQKKLQAAAQERARLTAEKRQAREKERADTAAQQAAAQLQAEIARENAEFDAAEALAAQARAAIM